jgi:YggT family protein
MLLFGTILWWALRLYSLVLIGRILLDWVRELNPAWRPRGFVLVIAEVIYTLTDWVLRRVRRLIPPLRIGPIALDLGLILLFIAIGWLQSAVLVYVR